MKTKLITLALVGAFLGSCSKPTGKQAETTGSPATTPAAEAPATQPEPAKPAAFASPFMEKLAPHLRHADGKAVAAADLAPAKQTLLYFSASWCGPCKAFTPKLIEQYQALRAAGIQVVLANRDKDTEKMLAYMTDHHQPWPGLPPEIQNDKTIDLSAFTERGIPSMALIAADGTLVKKGIAWTLLPEILKDLPAK